MALTTLNYAKYGDPPFITQSMHMYIDLDSIYRFRNGLDGKKCEILFQELTKF